MPNYDAQYWDEFAADQAYEEWYRQQWEERMAMEMEQMAKEIQEYYAEKARKEEERNKYPLFYWRELGRENDTI